MKILYIHCTADLYGASRMMLRSIAQQVKDGHIACVILPYEGPLVTALVDVGAEVEIVKVDPTLRKRNLLRPGQLIVDTIKGFFDYYKVAIEFSAELISSNTSITLLGGLLARKLNIPHICHVRESYSAFGWVWRFYRPYLEQYSQKILPVSQAMADQFPVRLHGNKVTVVHDGFPLQEFEPIGDERVNRFRKYFDLDERLVVGLVGRIILHRKGQDVFVRAVALLKNKYPTVKFVMVGSCYPGNEFHMENLNELIDELGVRDAVVLTGEADDVKTAYAAFDISVMASATPEPFGGVTIESMAFGKPVVGTNIGGTPEQIANGETGILIPPDDPQAMADSIARLIDDETLRLRMGKAGRKRFEEKFGFEPYYEKLMEQYREVCI
jgi:glycosyltransferase involved in cell wall biosynthesis